MHLMKPWGGALDAFAGSLLSLYDNLSPCCKHFFKEVLKETQIGVGEVDDVGQDARQLAGVAAEPTRQCRGELID